MISISANLNIMIKAAEKASKSIIRDFGEVEKLQVSKKGPNDFVTKTDKHVEKILIEELSKTKKNFSFSFLFFFLFLFFSKKKLEFFLNFILHLHLYCESSSGVEHHLAKVGVAGSNPVFRSTIKVNARVVELVDTLDLKSNDHCGRAGSSPASSTIRIRNILFISWLRILYLKSGNILATNHIFFH